MTEIEAIAVPADAVDEAKTYLRVEHEDEDALIARLAAAAIRHGEGFTGLVFLERECAETILVSAAWQRLSATPVRAIVSVSGIPAEGAAFALPTGGYALDIDSNGDGWVRTTQPGNARRIAVTYRAGVAVSWGAIPEALKQGTLRLTGHLHAVRDAADDPGPPAAVAALWRPLAADAAVMSGELAGALRERVSIETRLDQRDIIAGRVQGWQYDGAAWAAVDPIVPGDIDLADSLRNRPRWAVTMRKREGISAQTRLVWRGRFLAVRAVESDPREPSRMVLRCEQQD